MGTFVRMSTVLIGIGQRMLSVRSQLGYPQSKVAAILGIADKSYKNYELEKRELPLSIAVKFCEEFDKNLMWLVYGSSVPDSEQSARLAGEAAQAVFEHADANDKSLTSAEIQKFTRYIFEQSLSKGTSPQSEAKLFFSAIG
jgi:DNA-binding XRE family transcriptional regulator